MTDEEIKAKRKEYQRRYRIKKKTENAEEFQKKQKEYYLKNQVKLKSYYKNNGNQKEYHKKWSNKKYIQDQNYKIALVLRASTSRFLFKHPKKSKYIKIIGCLPEYFKKYIENQFKDGMNFDNYGIVWQLDHIKPLRAFDLTDVEQYLKAAHYSNVRPLLVKENQAKSDLINGINARSLIIR